MSQHQTHCTIASDAEPGEMCDCPRNEPHTLKLDFILIATGSGWSFTPHAPGVKLDPTDIMSHEWFGPYPTEDEAKLACERFASMIVKNAMGVPYVHTKRP